MKVNLDVCFGIGEARVNLPTLLGFLELDQCQLVDQSGISLNSLSIFGFGEWKKILILWAEELGKGGLF